MRFLFSIVTLGIAVFTIASTAWAVESAPVDARAAARLAAEVRLETASRAVAGTRSSVMKSQQAVNRVDAALERVGKEWRENYKIIAEASSAEGAEVAAIIAYSRNIGAKRDLARVALRETEHAQEAALTALYGSCCRSGNPVEAIRTAEMAEAAAGRAEAAATSAESLADAAMENIEAIKLRGMAGPYPVTRADNRCAICLGTEKGQLVDTKCEHLFHAVCIGCVKNGKCPVCRRDLMTGEADRAET